MSTSQSYSFGTPQNRDLIEDAYERVGIIPSLLTQQHLTSAQRTLNLILQTWPNKGNNLWTIKHGILGLNNNQSAYMLPTAAIDLKTATIRTANRVLGGTAFSSSGGTASLAFDNNPATACSQVAANGYISYDYGSSRNAISMVGIEVNITADYGFIVEYSLDNINWVTALSIPIQSYVAGQISWFSIPVPVPAKLYRVRQTESSELVWSNINFATWNEFTITPWSQWNLIPLNAEEIFFDNVLNDVNITRLSETEYTMLPNKLQTGRPTSFWVDRQISPIVYLWPTPNSVYNCMYFTYWSAIQDIGALTNNPDIPARFLEALTASLAYKLAIKEKAADLIPLLKQEAEEAYNQAGDEDSERVPLRVYPDFLGYM